MQRHTLQRIAMALSLLSVLFSATAHAGGWDTLAPEEKEKLERGEAVFESVKTDEKDGSVSGHGQSMVLIHASPETCWEQLTQFDRHYLFLPRQTASVVLETTQAEAFVRKTHKIFGFKMEFVLRYTLDSAHYRLDFEIDKTRPHDLEDTAGYFRFEEVKPGVSLLVYGITRVDTGVKTPRFVQKWLQKRDLPQVAVNIKKWVESGGTWKK